MEKQNKIYLLTGAAGFLGSNICSQLLSGGNKVKAFVLSGDPAAEYIPKEVEIFEGNLCKTEDCEMFFNVPKDTETFCIHCASMVTVNPDYSDKLMSVNVDGTKNMLTAMKHHPECKKFVYVSSTGAIPELPGGKPIKEVKHFYPYDENLVIGWYSRTKAIATQCVLDAAREGLDTCVVHPSGILGPVDHAIGETTGTMIKIINGKMPMGIDGSFNLGDVRDLARGVILACDRGKKGECYILGNDTVTFKDFSKYVSEEAHTKKVKFFLPLWLAYKVADKLEKNAKKDGKKPLMTSFSVYNLARNNNFDSSKAKTELGYTTRSYKETIHDMVDWLRQEKLIKVK